MNGYAEEERMDAFEMHARKGKKTMLPMCMEASKSASTNLL